MPSPSPWAYPIFRAIWVATLFSNFGGLIQSVGASWMMLSLSASERMVALVQASVALPILLLSLLAGALADNLDRRRVMLFAQTMMLVVSITLAAFAWAKWLTPETLLLFTFLIGCGTALNGPAWQASVGDMVERPALPSAIALNSMGFNIARSLGPAIGGAIVAAAGAAAAFLVNALSYVVLIGVLARWRPNRPPRQLPPERIDLAMASGVRYVAMSPNIRRVLLRALLFGLGASAVPALMPVVARDLVAGGPLTYGLLLGAFGVGAVGGALLVRRLRAKFTTEQIVRLASAAFAIGAATTGVSPDLFATIPALLLAGAGWVVALSTFNVTVQLAAPRWVVARALALYQMFAFGGMAAGSWIFGSLAEHQGIASALVAAAMLQIGGILLGTILPLPVMEEVNLDPLARWREPETSVPVTPRSGPIVITIEYRIREADIAAFLTVMGERRRIRLRDGARHWTLLRDLNDRELWIERYHVATWLDYLRHNQRRTQADAANIEQILALHIGPDRPLVQRMIERETHSLPGLAESDPHDLGPPPTDASGTAQI
ncbi:MFS transporter [Sandaracinobacter sp. RS1-74]|nr:MFS transporter [Sandaracinobacteroides sayramensis]MCG2841456.1 MFS transporter [Sandaracinobacteroides sayramensis]